MKITKIIILIVICTFISCSVRVKPYPATQRLTVKIPVTLAIDLAQIPETRMVSGSACIWLFNFGKNAYTVYLRDGFLSGAEYSFVDFADRIEKIDVADPLKKYDLTYQPILEEFDITAFLETRIKVKVKVVNSRGVVIYTKEITGISQNSNSACIMGFVGNVIFQNAALEMSVNSALENYYEQLYIELINNSEIKKLQEQKSPVSDQNNEAEKKVTVALKDGSEIIGVIISQDEKTLIIKTVYTTVKISKDKVEIINYNK